jgi:hypothetical protein
MQLILQKGQSFQSFTSTDYYMYKFLCIIFLSIFLSCSPEKPAEVGGQKPQEVGGVSYSLEITPVNATRNSTIYLVPHSFTISDAKIQWLVNGDLSVSPAPDRFNTAGIKKKDKVQAKAIIRGKEVLSNIVQIQNSPPEISSIKILPVIFKPGDTLSVEASGSDIDGDEVTLMYEWTKNGETAGKDKRLDVPLKRGDKLTIRITPFDGEAYGRSVVLQKEIVNLPPMIIESKKFSFDRNRYTYQINAIDPDGDNLTYSLKTAPPGMTIDPSSGLIQWNVPVETTGKTSITVSVTDGHGGEAIQNFNLDIKP